MPDATFREPSGFRAAAPLAVLLALVGAACGAETSANPCLGVDCSGHGTCTTDGFWALCACDPGYSPVDTACVGGDAGDVPDARDDADGDAGGDADGGGDDAADPGDVPPGCGDGLVALTEECDDGNDVEGDGCDADCTYSCHVAADCDDGNVCGEEVCLTEGAGRLCRTTPTAAGFACDDHNSCMLVDTCDGLGTCVGASPEAADTVCDDGLYCNGSPDACDGAGHCLPLSFAPCPIAGCVGGCDNATASCLPADPSVVCRPAAHQCDAAENCDGASIGCPGDAPAAAGTPCDDGDGCTVSDVCDGGGNCYGSYGC